MSFIRINIAVKPNSEVCQQVIDLSRKISSENEVLFVSDGINFLPHITLYSPEYPEYNFEKVLETVEHISKDMRQFEAKFSLFSSHLGYVDIALDKTNEWMNLHNLVVNQLNPLRDNHLREKYKHPKELAKYSSEQQNYILQFGYAEVFNAFRPHLTLSRLKDERTAKEIVASLQFPLKSFTVDTVAAYAMGDHGTCTKVIKEFPI